jgi:serine protease Do
MEDKALWLLNLLRQGMPRIAAVAAGVMLGGLIAVFPACSQRMTARDLKVSVADLAENLADAVVNISTAQTVQGQRSVPMPQVPDGSPFQEFFEEFFNRQNRDNDQPRRVQSLGSGFVLDGVEGIIITNNHVIEGADESPQTSTTAPSFGPRVIGTDEKTDIAVLKVEPETPLKAVDFGDSTGSGSATG